MAVSTVCPKCRRERQAGEDACARCGLLVARWSGFAVAPAHSDSILDALWARLVESWDDDSRHAQFLDQAAARGALDLAATRYSAKLRENESDPRAKAQLERAFRLAVELQPVTAEPALGPAARWLKLGGIVLAAGLLMATMWVLFLALTHR